MGLFNKLMTKIFGAGAPAAQPSSNGGAQKSGASAAPGSAGATPGAAASGAGQTTGGATQPSGTPQTVDVAANLDAMAARNPEKLDWKRSIVDLMKLVGMDSSLTARKELAKELNYTGDTNDSAAMNIWLHKQVLRKLSENGGKVPQELLS